MWQKMLLVILFFISFSSNANEVVYFDPNSVTLNGTIITLTFPGPPNYESIKKGDKAETGPYLILSNPIDIELPNSKSSKRDEIDEPQKNVKLLQLIVINQGDWKNIKEGNNVSVTGTLSSALTAHHHARALLMVNKINVISKQKISNKALDNISDEDKKFIGLK